MAETERSKRMVNSAPDYYQYSNVYKTMQEAMADDLNTVAVKNDDLQKQLIIITATWGLKYWEDVLGIPVNEADSYEIRRSRVLAKWRGFGNFSADLVKSVCEAFTNGEVSVKVRVPQREVVVTFIGVRGVPQNLSDLQTQVENIIHAHLGLTWKFTYLRWDEFDAANKTWDAWDALNLTWDAWEVYKP